MTTLDKFTLDLDGPDDPGPYQVSYLSSVLRENAAPDGPGFGIRFQYDMDGTSHWNGELYVLEVSVGRCFLRYANSEDTSEPVKRWSMDQLRAKFRAPGPKPKTPRSRSFVVELDVPWCDLRGEDVREAFELLRVAAVMES